MTDQKHTNNSKIAVNDSQNLSKNNNEVSTLNNSISNNKATNIHQFRTIAEFYHIIVGKRITGKIY